MNKLNLVREYLIKRIDISSNIKFILSDILTTPLVCLIWSLIEYQTIEKDLIPSVFTIGVMTCIVKTPIQIILIMWYIIKYFVVLYLKNSFWVLFTYFLYFSILFLLTITKYNAYDNASLKTYFLIFGVPYFISVCWFYFIQKQQSLA
jgi:hypothetical protein